MEMKITALLTALLLLAPAAASAAKIYKWTDAQGNVIYSDTPRPGAVELDVATDPAGIVPVPAQAPAKPGATPAEADAYRILRVVAPADQDLLENTGGWVGVSLVVEPALLGAKGHAIRLRLDGQTLDTRYPGGEIALPNVERGQHTLEAEVVDPTGAVLITSAPVAFTMSDPSSQTPAGPDIYPPTYPGQAYPPTYKPVYPPQPYPPQGKPKTN
jgi:hypothetical protein